MSKVINKPVVLVGMMGSGKSHVGCMLGERLGVSFYDADKIIEDEQGKTVADVFSQNGEAAFRALEGDLIARLLEDDASVISTGGGAVITPSVLEAIKNKSVSVWLQTSVDKIIPRVINDKNRPLLQCGDPKSKLNALMEVREPLYAQADIHVTNEDISVEETVCKIVQALHKYM